MKPDPTEKRTTRKEIRRKQRVNSSGADVGVLHRVDLSTCPCCPSEEYPYDGHTMNHVEWMKHAVTLVMTPAVWKKGCVAIISECPSCFGLSWVHQNISTIVWNTEVFPADWRRAAERQRDAWRLDARVEWQNSLCRGCAHLDGEPKLDASPVWRSCAEGGVGIGPLVPNTKTCPKFKTA